MSATLHVKDDHQLLGAANTSRTFDAGKLTIGRGPENDWVLPDPERIISKQHCLIEANDGVYSLTDTSSNGVFVNSSDKPVGRGNKVVLKDGDHFRISHFRIEIRMTDERAGITSPESGEAEDPFGSSGFAQTEGEDALADIFGTAERTADSLSPGGTDVNRFDEPHDGLADTHDSGTSSDLGVGVDSASSDHEYFRAPEPIPETPAIEEIPDDWDEEWTGEPAAEVDRQPASPSRSEILPDEDFALDNVALMPETSRGAETDRLPEPELAPAQFPPSQPASPRSRDETAAVGTSESLDRSLIEAFLEGAALDEVEIPVENVHETMRVIGALYRETVKGLREVLSARSSIKSEFRLSQTTIQPVENNPLKFSLGDDDAMTALLTNKGKGYLPPSRAIHEAFGDVKAHQVAVIVGMQAALTGLLVRFNPKALEDRINEESSAVGALLRNKKSMYWDEFAKLYETIAAEAEDDFQSVFGREFGKAYEKQVRKQTRRD